MGFGYLQLAIGIKISIWHNSVEIKLENKILVTPAITFINNLHGANEKLQKKKLCSTLYEEILTNYY